MSRGALLLALSLPLLGAGCAALPMALSAAGGAVSLAHNVLDLDTSLRQLIAVKGATSSAAPTEPKSAF